MESCDQCGGIIDKSGKCLSNIAFQIAIQAGRLSENPRVSNYAGNYMFMGSHNGKDHFKNRNSRKYDV